MQETQNKDIKNMRLLLDGAGDRCGCIWAGRGIHILYGLTAQKDNREETIIRYEAHYWAEVLQADGVVDDLNYPGRVS